jgi:hypothetical protein
VDRLDGARSSSGLGAPSSLSLGVCDVSAIVGSWVAFFFSPNRLRSFADICDEGGLATGSFVVAIEEAGNLEGGSGCLARDRTIRALGPGEAGRSSDHSQSIVYPMPSGRERDIASRVERMRPGKCRR